jgi:hypothetical protein
MIRRLLVGSLSSVSWPLAHRPPDAGFTVMCAGYEGESCANGCRCHAEGEVASAEGGLQAP